MQSQESPVAMFGLSDGALAGPGVVETCKTIGQLQGVFVDEAARATMDPETVAYRVRAHLPVAEQTPGGLFFGVSCIEPGVVGDEYFMTRGHFHARAQHGEYYWGIRGSGLLVLMDVSRQWRVKQVIPGALHYIPGHTAHRLVNTGDAPLVVGACWSAEAGHDYASIERDGFAVRVFRQNGVPHMVEAS